MRIFSYNAPFTLTFALVCTAVASVDTFLPARPLSSALALNRGVLEPIGLLKAVTYVFSHQDWSHLFGNLSLILVLGPQLEERLGTWSLLMMSFVTTFTSGALSMTLLHHGIMGASGVVFLFITLSSFACLREPKIPLTFVLVALLFLCREAVGVLRRDNISHFAHLAGGGFGAIFGFLLARRR